MIDFRSSRATKRARDRLLDVCGYSGHALDRLAVTLSLVRGPLDNDVERVWPSDEHETGCSHQIETIDDFDGRQVFHPVLSALEGRALSEVELGRALQRHLNRGYDLLYETFEDAGSSWDQTLRRLSPAPRPVAPRRSGSITGVTVKFGTRPDSGAPVEWTVNREAGVQTNANARLAGLPGVGKSQSLLHLLAAVAQQDSDMGFFLLDYKGDLAGNDGFLKTTGATVLRPGESPIPVNPFQLPDGVNRTLAPRAFADLFETLEPRLGRVQKQLVSTAMQQAYLNVPPQGDRNYPTLREVVTAIEQVYAQAGRTNDSVLATLADLTGYHLFSEVSERPLAELFSARWVIDLSGLRGLREFVAFVILEFLHQAALGSADTAYDPESSLRELRAVIAIDEAHYYLRRRCQPLLELLRIGRSKGLPVFLSSQSLEDFRKQTELNEFLPNTFLFRHGGAMDRKAVSSALGLTGGQADVAASMISSLDKFSVLTNVARSGPVAPIKMTGFWQLEKGR